MDQNDLPQSFHLLAPVSSSFRAADLHPAPATIPNNWSSELPLVLTGGENSNGSFGEITSGDYTRCHAQIPARKGEDGSARHLDGRDQEGSKCRLRSLRRNLRREV